MTNLPVVVVLDADGVVVVGDKAGDASERDYGISRVATRSFFEGDFLDCLVGAADLKDCLASQLPRWGWNGTVEEYLDYWFRVERNTDEALLQLVDAFRAAGIRSFLATNQERYRTTYLKNEMRLGARFDGVFSSAEIGHRKPNAAFFDYITKQLRQEIGEPVEIVFFDGAARHECPSNERGFHSVGCKVSRGVLRGAGLREEALRDAVRSSTFRESLSLGTRPIHYRGA